MIHRQATGNTNLKTVPTPQEVGEIGTGLMTLNEEIERNQRLMEALESRLAPVISEPDVAPNATRAEEAAMSRIGGVIYDLSIRLRLQNDFLSDLRNRLQL